MEGNSPAIIDLRSKKETSYWGFEMNILLVNLYLFKLRRISFKALIACWLLRAEMPSPLNSPTPCFIYFSLTSILLIVCHLGYITGTAVDDNSTIIGAIIDANSRKGKEEITAIKIAVDKFNNNSKNHKLSLISRNFTGELYGAALTGWSSLPWFLLRLSNLLLFSTLIL